MEGAGGGCSEKRWRVRFLLEDSLLPLSTLTKPSPILTNEAEKKLLLTLTSVLREVSQWASQVGDLPLDQVEGENPVLGRREFCDSRCDGGASGDGCDCLEHVVALLVSFLAVENLYVQHLTGKIAVEIFEFLLKSADGWEEFLHLLWISFEASFHITALFSNCSQSEDIVNASPMPLSPFMDNFCITKKFACNIVNSIALFHPSSPKENRCMLTPLVKVLRDISKLVKVDHGDLLKRCAELAITSLSAYPWSLLKSSHSQIVSRGSCSGEVVSDPLAENLILTTSDSMLFGVLLQMLCSMVDQKVPEGDAIVNDYSVYSRLMSLVQKFVFSSLCKEKEYNIGIRQYLRHKALMLMIRLSGGAHWKCSYVMTWMKILGQYFEDLLYQPMWKCHKKVDNALEGSPFQTSFIVKEVDVLCSCHLQRQANFLFLKCCFASSHFSGESAAGCVDWAGCRDVCSKELYKWLAKHLLVDKLLVHSPSYRKFSLLLLQLYLDEDDLLFELLLLLMDSAYLDVQVENNECSGLFFIAMGSDIAPYISSIFNPIHLFHLFLSLLHYDHMVLLDYLISKDTGIQCLRYVMRCLHSICRSWSMFVKFSLSELDNGLLDSQERRGSLVEGDISGCPLQKDTDSCMQIEKKNKKLRDHGKKQQMTRHHTFKKAKNCLLSLKTSIEDLHRKNLFPYNPAALLRSFSRFQNRCNDVS